ncbi:MAG TPA: hypothetical protein VME21_03155 [Steroidobacteraceae bacterium]|nr:hypothetical protein [Steroidobacteraceae bacterium]
MSKGPHARKLSEGNTVALDMHALGTLQYIRAAIDAAGVLAVPGSAGIAMGCVGVAAALLAAHPAFAPHWLLIWVIASVAAFLCGSALIAHQALRTERALFRRPTRKFLLLLAPPLLVGAVLTLSLWREHEESLIPGLWLLLYGSAVSAASTLTGRLVGIMGGLFLVLGVTALALPPVAGNWLLGGGFGGLHLLFGVLIGRANNEQH